MDLTVTYGPLPQGGSAFELIGRGFWLRWNPVEDELTPDHAFANRPPNYMRLQQQ